MIKCKICLLFDCGPNCKCIYHNLVPTDKIKHNLTPDDNLQLQQITQDDITLVAQQASVSFETAKRFLIKSNGDLAKAILELKRNKTSL